LSFVAPLTALLNKESSGLTYETLTECKLYEVPFDDFMQLVNSDIDLSKLYIKTELVI
jgi:hypothetical protein